MIANRKRARSFGSYLNTAKKVARSAYGAISRNPSRAAGVMTSPAAAIGVAAGVQTALSYMNRKQKNQGTKKTLDGGNLKGFIRPARLIGGRRRGYKKRGRRSTIVKKRNLKFDNGVRIEKEGGAILTGKYCRYFGHATFGAFNHRILICRAILKKMLQKENIPIESFNQLVNVYNAFPATANVAFHLKYLVYSGSAVPVTTTATRNYTTTAADSLSIIAEEINALISGVYGGISDEIEVKHLTINWAEALQGNLKVYTFQFDDGYVKMATKSALKIQNRTVGVGGNQEEDAVDKQPLSGFAYYGFGAGMVPAKYDQSGDWLADDLTAKQGECQTIIPDEEIPVVTTSDKLLLEPRDKKYFSGPTKQTKVKMNPGDIKTSVLKYSKIMKMNTAMKHIFEYQSSAASAPFRRQVRDVPGKFAIFALEKVLETAASIETTSSFSIAVECALDLYMAVYEKKRFMTLPDRTVNINVAQNAP
jgi:hypothetical protein